MKRMEKDNANGKQENRGGYTYIRRKWTLNLQILAKAKKNIIYSYKVQYRKVAQHLQTGMHPTAGRQIQQALE